MKKRGILLFLAVILISVVLSACSEAQPENSAIESFSDDPSIVLIDESSSESIEEEVSEELEEESIEAQPDEEYDLFTVDSKNTFALLDGKFIPISEAVEPVEFEKTVKSEREYTLMASYNLYGDSEKQEVTIEAIADEHDDTHVTATISVNEVTFKGDISTFLVGAGIVDLDTADDTIEIALFSQYPTGDGHITFYRYDGEKIEEIGTVNGGYEPHAVEIAYPQVYLDQKGKVVAGENKIMLTSQPIVAAYYQLSNSTLKLCKTDMSEAFNQTFRISDVFFELLSYEDGVPLEVIEDSEENDYNITYNFEKGEEFTLIDAGSYNDNLDFSITGGAWVILRLKDGKEVRFTFPAAG